MINDPHLDDSFDINHGLRIARKLLLDLATLGLPAGKDSSPLSFDFKWADNLQHPGDPLDFYVSGDVAPDARFKYRYSTR